jgi:hypothetical protein
MSQQPFILYAIFSVVPILHLELGHDAKEPSHLKPQTLEQIEEASKRHLKLFSEISETRLYELKRGDDLELSLAAAWKELCLRSGGKDSSKPGVTDRQPVDRDAANYFLGFVEGRTKSELPEWWKRALISAHIDNGQYGTFGRLAKIKYQTTGLGFDCSTDTIINRKEEITDIVLEKSRYCIQNRFLDLMIAEAGGKRAGDNIIFRNGQKRKYMAVYMPAGFHFRLVCFTSETKTHNWTADVWAAGRREANGRPFHWVEICEDRERVFVYGMDSFGIYLEEFDAKTGKNLVRFASSSWRDSKKQNE